MAEIFVLNRLRSRRRERSTADNIRQELRESITSRSGKYKQQDFPLISPVIQVAEKKSVNIDRSSEGCDDACLSARRNSSLMVSSLFVLLLLSMN